MFKQPPAPQGTLTGPQLRIMNAVWAAGPEGAAIAEIWQQDADQDLARTTILTVVQRLEKRGWLIRKGLGRKLRYVAACTREQTLGQLSKSFVDEFFGGSATNLIMALVDQRGISSTEAKHLHALINASDQSVP